VRSAADASHLNRRVSFKSDVQESLKLIDTKPSLNFVWKDSHHKHKSRKHYDKFCILIILMANLVLETFHVIEI
jgi:hypothetical protein